MSTGRTDIAAPWYSAVKCYALESKPQKIRYNAVLHSSNDFPIVFEEHFQSRGLPKFDRNVEGVALMHPLGQRGRGVHRCETEGQGAV
jgi:hypothetical protein